jgi:hypothetical protein
MNDERIEKHRVVCSSLIYGFWLPLWYLKTHLIKVLPQRSLEFSCYSIFSSYRMWHWRCFVFFSEHECGQNKQMKFWHIKTKSNKRTDEGSMLQHTQTPQERPCGSHGSWSWGEGACAPLERGGGGGGGGGGQNYDFAPSPFLENS